VAVLQILNPTDALPWTHIPEIIVDGPFRQQYSGETA
jgi:hypothetical protein